MVTYVKNGILHDFENPLSQNELSLFLAGELEGGNQRTYTPPALPSWTGLIASFWQDVSGFELMFQNPIFAVVIQVVNDGKVGKATEDELQMAISLMGIDFSTYTVLKNKINAALASNNFSITIA